jgi:hypothetical protein
MSMLIWGKAPVQVIQDSRNMELAERMTLERPLAPPQERKEVWGSDRKRIFAQSYHVNGGQS